MAKDERRRRYRRLMSVLFVVAVITVFTGIITSYLLFRSSNTRYREEVIAKTARLASLQIDGDNVDRWLTDGADSDYLVTKGRLTDILDNTPYLLYLYVYRIEPDGCRVIFDLENSSKEVTEYDVVPDAPFNALGDVIEFDDSLSEYLPTLLKGGRIDIVETKDEFGWLLTCYEPVYDSEGRCVAYVGLDMTMEGINSFNNTFFIWLSIFSTVLLLVSFIISFKLSSRFRMAEEREEDVRSRKKTNMMLRGVIEAFARVIDLKDPYTQGHSTRVADYAVKIAQMVGKDHEECEKIYYAGLLHDVGKILVPNDIINKQGKLTDEEFNAIKQHTVNGFKILSSISDFPYLAIGAHHHHERYDGKGYPDKLKGEDIPEIARIISVADAYDAMSSNRSYRDAIPQDLVREEIVKGAGTQFDPKFAKVMQHLIDLDTTYQMKERASQMELGGDNELLCDSNHSEVSEGVILSQKKTHISFRYDKVDVDRKSSMSLILFDSLDGHVHTDERAIRDLCFFEYCELKSDGSSSVIGARKIQTSITEQKNSLGSDIWVVEAVRCGDHVLVKAEGSGRALEAIIALPDRSRYSYLSLTGDNCRIFDVRIENDEENVPDDYIPRIAEAISYINVPEGDVPNVQVDGYRSASTDGIPINGGFDISFHTMSLPTARLIWHCPFVVIFSSDNGKVDGANYKEYALIRFDGENWESEGTAENQMVINKRDDFAGWDNWKKKNKEGFDAVVSVTRAGNNITVTTENLGIFIKNTTTLIDGSEDVYVALSGDQCALTGIRIMRGV